VKSRSTSTRLHGATSQKTRNFIFAAGEDLKSHCSYLFRKSEKNNRSLAGRDIGERDIKKDLSKMLSRGVGSCSSG
jgi:hypothetical protein